MNWKRMIAVLLVMAAPPADAAEFRSLAEISGIRQSSDVPVMPASAFTGRAVVASDGLWLGSVSDTLVELESGVVAFVVAKMGDRQGAEFAGIPWRLVANAPREDSVLRLKPETGQLSRFTLAELEEMTRSPFASSPASGRSPPALIATQGLRGAPVSSANGARVGSIDQVAIDLELGRVAYVLVGRDVGGWLPVPYQALVWRSATLGYRLAADALEIALPTVAEIRPPPDLKRSDLEALFGYYGVPPYWR